MSRYGTPFCSDEELMEELNKLGYDEVSPDVFSMMKDDLSELVEKEQNDPLLSDYDCSDVSPVSSKFLSTSSDALIECRTTKESKKSDSSVSKKVKKKFQNATSRILKANDAKRKGLETSRYQNDVIEHKVKSSNVSLGLENTYKDDDLSDFDISQNKYSSTNRLKSNDTYNDDNLSDFDVLQNNYNSVNRLKTNDAYNDDDLSDFDVSQNKYNAMDRPQSNDVYDDLSDFEGSQNKYNSLNRQKSNDDLSDFDSLQNKYSLNELKSNDDLSDLDCSQNKYNSVNRIKSNDTYSKSHNVKADVNRNDDKYDNGRGFTSKEKDFKLNYSSSSDRLLNSDTSVPKYRSNTTKDEFTSSYGKSYDQDYSLSHNRKTLTDNSLENVKEAFKTFKLEKKFSESDEPMIYNYKGSDLNLNTSQSSTSSETKTIKRKVLRRRNGRSVITEEIVQIPSIFDTSYPESETFNNSKSFSSDDLSCKSNNSTGSVNAVSPESSIKSSPSTFSLLSTRSTSLRVPNPRKKKSDPVAMYGYYRKFWDNFKPPGENTHDRLRWAVRDKMLDYNI